MTSSTDKADPYREVIYSLENLAVEDSGRRFVRFVEIETFVESVLLSPWWEQQFPEAPIEVQLFRRSRSATFSAAAVDRTGNEAAIWIRDGSWDAVTVVHELAHVASAQRAHSPDPTGAHGQEFATVLLLLWKELLGLHAYGALRSGFDGQGVPYRRERLF
jgi:putative metallohydrolase (TIGR04338 family)